MTKNLSLTLTENNFKEKIYTIRGVQVMLDEDLAFLYNVETRILNQTVARNKDRFPDEFCFQLTESEQTNGEEEDIYPMLSQNKEWQCYLQF